MGRRQVAALVRGEMGEHEEKNILQARRKECKFGLAPHLER